jgi:uncharacterized protein (UPF0548 family)
VDADRLLRHPSARKALDDLHERVLNFDLAQRDEFTPASGWHIDDLCQPLPSEPPGPPVPGGSWEVASRLMRGYEFADPSIVRAIFYPDHPLENRDMLLEVRFYGLRFHVGVRVGGMRDEMRDVAGRQVRVWGWTYSTLEGHLEMGQMDYETWKWLDSGQVEFRVQAFSRAARRRNPLVRLGFRLFGRRQQLKFYRRACARMVRLTEAELERGSGGDPVPRVADRLTVQPMSDAYGLGN